MVIQLKAPETDFSVKSVLFVLQFSKIFPVEK